MQKVFIFWELKPVRCNQTQSSGSLSGSSVVPGKASRHEKLHKLQRSEPDCSCSRRREPGEGAWGPGASHRGFLAASRVKAIRIASSRAKSRISARNNPDPAPRSREGKGTVEGPEPTQGCRGARGSHPDPFMPSASVQRSAWRGCPAPSSWPRGPPGHPDPPPRRDAACWLRYPSPKNITFHRRRWQSWWLFSPQRGDH